MHYAHLKHLIEQAISSLKDNAEALRAVHSLDGRWMLEDPADEHALAEYERDIELVENLRAALPEFTRYHETAKGLEQLLRAHRLQGAQINYQDLAALLPTSDAEPQQEPA